MDSDLKDMDDAIAEINKNYWFSAAIKAAIAIGDDADRDVLAKFTGDSSMVFDAHSSDRLRDVIEFIVPHTCLAYSIVASNVDNECKPEDDEARRRFADDSEEEDVDRVELDLTGWTVRSLIASTVPVFIFY
jgi:hypothetical protein